MNLRVNKLGASLKFSWIWADSRLKWTLSGSSILRPGSSKYKITAYGTGHKFFQISAENRLKTTPGGTVLKRRDRTWYGPGTVLNLDEQKGPRGNVGNVYVVPWPPFRSIPGCKKRVNTLHFSPIRRAQWVFRKHIESGRFPELDSTFQHSLRKCIRNPCQIDIREKIFCDIGCI